MGDILLHVGLPKTGTTTIQSALFDRAEVLAAAGVLLPGGRRAQKLAAFDLLGQRVGGDDAVVAGAFNRLVAEISASTMPRAVWSEEELGLCRPRHVQRIVGALDGHRVHVVVGIRDLGRTLVSAWQQSVVMGATTTWADFVTAVGNPSSGVTRAAAGFAARHELLRVLDAWGTQVPPDRIRLVTVPPRGTPASVLLERFACAADLPPNAFAAGHPVFNQSLGSAEIEVIRRLNARLAGRLLPRQLRTVITVGIRPGLRIPGSCPVRLPPEDVDWVREREDRLVQELRQRGHPVYGDLSDLVRGEPTDTGRRPDDVSERQLLEATEVALAALAIAHGRLTRRHRRARGGQQQTVESGRAQRIASAARAAIFRLQKATLTGAEHNRVLAWTVRRYLSRGPAGHPYRPPATRA